MIIFLEKFDAELFNTEELEKEVVLQDSNKSMLLSEDLDILLQIDSTSMEKFQERLEIF